MLLTMIVVSEPIKPADPVTIAILITSTCELSRGIGDSPSPAEGQDCPIALVLFRSLVHDLIEKAFQGLCNSGRPIRLLRCFYRFALVFRHNEKATRTIAEEGVLWLIIGPNLDWERGVGKG